jgi:hypothetical protein
VSALAFAAAPDYQLLKALFKQLFVDSQFTYDSVLYDWELLAYQQQQQQRSEG